MFHRRNHAERPGGFTLVELLVVIAIIGILVALLLPAVQAAREAARRNSCTNHLKQLGLAVQMHHDAKRRYPMGRTGTDQFAVAWGFQLLPFLEENPVFEAYNERARVDDDTNALAMRTPVEVFNCPSRRPPAADRDFDNNDSPSLVPGVGARGDYAANAGITTLVGFVNGTDRAAPVNRAEVGPMYSFSKISARRVRDGLSHTLAVGERHIPPVPANASAGQAHYLQGDTAFFAGDNRETVLRGAAGGLAGDRDDPSREKFGSVHSGITLFAFLDGHVGPIENGIEESELAALSAIGDGRVVSQ